LLTELAQVIHKHDCKTFIQLFHSGAWNPTGLLPRRGRDVTIVDTIPENKLGEGMTGDIGDTKEPHLSLMRLPRAR
jgi:hypothetical protein